ncbi:MAG: ATP-dependent Clp protease ATP-binding subunit [Deltaproteobacteria bacterium]|nr:ATP-dependent Clp protease ATP-binding subunit [Deltaproteobacteria bacterium]
MAVSFDPECQRAIDAAKAAVAENVALDPALLLAALFHETSLCNKLPDLSPVLPRPTAAGAPRSKVPLTSELRPIFTNLAAEEKKVTAAALFRRVVETPAGRAALAPLSNAEIDKIVEKLVEIEPGPSADGKAAGTWRGSPERAEALRALAPFGRTLTETAPPVRWFGSREHEIGALVRSLIKMKRRSAIIVGHPGTGKTVLVYELCRRVVAREPSLPAVLHDLDVFELSPTFLRAGASIVGQYEERLQGVVKVLKKYPRIVLFVDEIHSFLSSGMHNRGPFSEANESLKAELGRGEITCIGCTTLSEYRHYIEPDGALARRFSVIMLEEASRTETVAILRSRRPAMEKHFSLEIPDALLERAVDLARDHLLTRREPDRSIQLVEEACAFASTRVPPDKALGEDALLAALEDTLGRGILRSENLCEDSVYQRLRAKIVGQDAVLRAASRAFVAGLAHWRRERKPRGVFMFAGPTGVGKTETALALAEILGAGKTALLRVDCNTLADSSASRDGGPAVFRLLGPPPGFLGYVRGAGGLLSRVRDRPESVILFDEIEKAPPKVTEIILQAIDTGQVDDSDGNPLDFTRAFFIMTTNCGWRDSGHRQVGFSHRDGEDGSGDPTGEREVRARLAQEGFGAEFLGRIGHFFRFRSLTVPAVREIVSRQLAELAAQTREHGLRLDWSPAVESHLVERWQPHFGARFMKQILEGRVIEQLGLAAVQGELAGAETVRIESAPDPDPALQGLARRRRNGNQLVIELA